MADKVTIVNRGLSLLGAEPITDLTDNTPEANIASRFYDESRKSILSECLWNFATKREALNIIASPGLAYIENQNNFVFQLPSDIIRIFAVSCATCDWRIERDTLITDTDEIGIKYVYDLTDTTAFSSSFVDAFADKLASDMAYAILNSNTEAKLLLEKYNSQSLPKAMTENAQEGTPPAIDDSLWVFSKYGFSPVNSRGVRFA
jgi:hypothetical protein